MVPLFSRYHDSPPFGVIRVSLSAAPGTLARSRAVEYGSPETHPLSATTAAISSTKRKIEPTMR